MDFISNARLSDDKNTHVWVGWKRFFFPESISTWIVNHQILGRWAMFDSNCLAYLKSKSCALKPMVASRFGVPGLNLSLSHPALASCDDSWSGLQCHVEWSQSHHGGEMVYMVYGMKLQQVNIHVFIPRIFWKKNVWWFQKNIGNVHPEEGRGRWVHGWWKTTIWKLAMLVESACVCAILVAVLSL